MLQQLKRIAAPFIIAATLGLFAYYGFTHPEVVRRLQQLSIATIIEIVLLLFVTFVALALVLSISLQMYNKRLPLQESVLLNAYSTILNFFGPGQSGPAVRGAYLYKKHGFKVKSYVFTTLLYYGCYAVICAFMLCVGSRPWWQTIIVMAAAVVCSVLIIRWYTKRSKQADIAPLSVKNIGFLFGATALQLTAQAAIFYVELHTVDPSISVAQTITYTGAASLALFVSLTPGAIGIREAFLVFSQQLHHISSATIVAANVIDRAIYVAFLGILFVIILSLHANKRFTMKSS